MTNHFPAAFASIDDLVAVHRESMRGRIALAVVGLMVLFALLMILFVWIKGATDADVLVTGIFTPIVGVVGTVVGFYFGSQDKKDAN